MKRQFGWIAPCAMLFLVSGGLAWAGDGDLDFRPSKIYLVDPRDTPRVWLGGENNAILDRALDTKMSFDFREKPLNEFFDELSQRLNVNFRLDQKAIDAAGVANDIPITASLADIRVRSALALILRQLDLTFLKSNDVILITSTEEASNKLTTVVYPVMDLVLVGVDDAGNSQPDFDTLVDLITGNIQPPSWDSVGGQGSTKGDDASMSLTISNTQEVQDGVAGLLAQLRKARDLQGIKPIARLPDDYFSTRHNNANFGAPTGDESRPSRSGRVYVDSPAWQTAHVHEH